MVTTRSESKSENTPPADIYSNSNESTAKSQMETMTTEGNPSKTEKKVLIYDVTSNYEKTEDTELNVVKGDRVKVLKVDESWCTVFLLSAKDGKRTGQIPAQHIKSVSSEVVNTLKCYEDGYVITDYKARTETELSVNLGDWVKVLNVEKEQYQVEVIHPKDDRQRIGFVPRIHLTPAKTCDRKLKEGAKTCDRKLLYMIGAKTCDRKLLYMIGVCVSAVIIAVLGVICTKVFNYFDKSENSSFNLTQRLRQIEVQYPHIPGNKIWDTLEPCLVNAMNADSPCIILMLSDGRKDFSNFFYHLGLLTKDMFNDEESDVIELNGSILTESDAEYFFDKYKSELEKKKVLLVKNVEKIPSSIMVQFHSLCDVNDPAVKQAVILLTLNYEGSKITYTKNDATYAMDILNEIWEKYINPDTSPALFARITENIIVLSKKEPKHKRPIK